MALVEWHLSHGLVHPTEYGSIGVMHLLTPEGRAGRRAVVLSLSETGGDSFHGEYGVGDEFLLGPQLWRVESVEGSYPDYRAHVVVVGSEHELAGDDGWEYHLCDRDAGGDPVHAGTIIRVRPGGDLRQGFEAAPDGVWVPSDWLHRVAVGREPGHPVRISNLRMRARLTRWVAARRLVRLPADVQPLGCLVSGEAWDYFLLLPEPAVAEGGGLGPDLGGDMLRCRSGGPYVEGWRFAESGEWVPDDILQREWAQGPGRAAPVSQPIAWWLMTWWVNRGRFPKLPADVYAMPHRSRPVSGEWEFFAVRDAGQAVDGDRPTGRIMAHRAGTSYRDGLVFSADRRWVEGDDLFAAVVLEVPQVAVEQITEQAAREELDRRFGDGSYLPPGAGGVPYPWNLTHSSRRRDAVGALPVDASSRALAVTAVRRLVARLAARGPVDWEAVPEDLDEGWPFVSMQIAEQVPRLGDDNAAGARAWLVEQQVEQADSLADLWVSSVHSQAVTHAASWLAHHGTEAEGRAMADVAAGFWRVLPDWVTSALLRVAVRFAPIAVDPLLCQLSTNPGVGPDLREFVPAPARVDAILTGAPDPDRVGAWLAKVGLHAGEGNAEDVAAAVVAGEPVTGWVTLRQGVQRELTVTTRNQVITVQFAGPILDEGWSVILVVDTARMLGAQVVTLTEGEPPNLDAARAGQSLPRWLWLSAAQVDRYEQAQEVASDVHFKDDGALLISR